jgi:hypothetical protein
MPLRPSRSRTRQAAAPIALTLAVGLAACSHATAQRDPRDAPVAAPASFAPDAGAAIPELHAADVDQALRAAWAHAGVAPAPRVDDARFLRRAWLDIAGVVPPPEAVQKFAADPSPDKRRAAIAELVASPRWAERWANVWERLLLGPMVRIPIVDRAGFHEWVRAAFASNMPYDQFAYQLVTATGRNQSQDDDAAPVNGAVNWLLRFRGVPEDLAGTTSRVFLGVQIQCAQCHDHKTEKWTQTDFRRFTACFLRTKAERVDKGGDKRMNNRDLLVRDTEAPAFLRQGKKMIDKNPAAAAPPGALDGTDLAQSPNPRQALARWMIDPRNPWFARAFVNRVWSQLLGRGFVEPVDDLRPSNAPVLGELLDRLAADFSAHGYDVRRLVALVAETEAYQLGASAPASTTAGDAGAPAPSDPQLWSRFPLKPLPPDELMDAIVAATGAEPVLERVAGDDMQGLRDALRRQMAFVFDVDEQPDETTYQGTVAQALMLLNGRLVNGSASVIPGDALATILEHGASAPMGNPAGVPQTPPDEAVVDALYLRTLSRLPSQDERDHWVAFVRAPREAVAFQPSAPPSPRRGGKGNPAKAAFVSERRLARTERMVPRQETPRQQAFEDMLWALLNSSEFYFNH